MVIITTKSVASNRRIDIILRFCLRNDSVPGDISLSISPGTDILFCMFETLVWMRLESVLDLFGQVTEDQLIKMPVYTFN